MVLKFEFELFILDDFRKVSKSKIGVPLRVPFWAGVRIRCDNYKLRSSTRA